MLIPRHIAIIMDGNNRWAIQHGLPAIEGHRKGVGAIRRTMDTALELGIEYITLYAFSVDNWKRPKEEVDSLMNLVREFLKKEKDDIKDKDVRFIVIGRSSGIPQDILDKIEELTELTKDNKRLRLIVALNYGARSEIVDAVKKIIKNNIPADSIDEESFARYLYTDGIPDPELFIRTSGEMRLSNFLLWQLSYTELWITPTHWPDFGKGQLLEAIEEFNKRQRRFGGRVNVTQADS